MQVSDLFQLRMQRLAEEVRAAAVQSLIHERQNPVHAEVPADPCPMLSRGGVPDLSERFPPVPSAPQLYAQYGGAGAQPRVQLGRRQRRDAGPPAPSAKMPRVEGSSFEQHPSRRGGSSVANNASVRSAGLHVDTTPSTREAVLSNDDAASLLLALSPKATPRNLSPAGVRPGHGVMAGQSFEQMVPGGAMRGVPMARCPSLVSEPGGEASSSAPGPANPYPWQASQRLEPPSSAPGPANPYPWQASQRLEPRGEVVSRSLSTLEALPLSREASGIPLSACLSLLKDEDLARGPDAASPFAGGAPFAGAPLAGVPFSRDLSKISVSGFLAEDEPSPEPLLPPAGGEPAGGERPAGLGPMKGVPMIKDISGISMTGCLNMLE
jgi:hypothetical protein